MPYYIPSVSPQHHAPGLPNLASPEIPNQSDPFVDLRARSNPIIQDAQNLPNPVLSGSTPSCNQLPSSQAIPQTVPCSINPSPVIQDQPMPSASSNVPMPLPAAAPSSGLPAVVAANRVPWNHLPQQSLMAPPRLELSLFDGTTSLEAWLSEVATCSLAGAWPEHVILGQMLSHLRGFARSVYDAYADRIVNVATLRQHLTQAFLPEDRFYTRLQDVAVGRYSRVLMTPFLAEMRLTVQRIRQLNPSLDQVLMALVRARLTPFWKGELDKAFSGQYYPSFEHGHDFLQYHPYARLSSHPALASPPRSQPFHSQSQPNRRSAVVMSADVQPNGGDDKKPDQTLKTDD